MVLRFKNCGHLKHIGLVENRFKILPKVTDCIMENGLNYMEGFQMHFVKSFGSAVRELFS
jgi:hypothetical protein